MINFLINITNIYSKYLTRAYVRGLLRKSGFLNNEIDQNMEKLKRQQIMMKRTLKNFKEWRNDYEQSNSRNV